MPTPRVTVPVRNQAEIQLVMPEDALPPDHPARVLWSVISRLDLSAFLVDASAFEGGLGSADHLAAHAADALDATADSVPR